MDKMPECLQRVPSYWEADDERRHSLHWSTMAFTCPSCGRHVCGLCEGAADDMPEHCDNCWVEAHKNDWTKAREDDTEEG